MCELDVELQQAEQLATQLLETMAQIHQPQMDTAIARSIKSEAGRGII